MPDVCVICYPFVSLGESGALSEFSSFFHKHPTNPKYNIGFEENEKKKKKRLRLPDIWAKKPSHIFWTCTELEHPFAVAKPGLILLSEDPKLAKTEAIFWLLVVDVAHISWTISHILCQ